MAKILFIATVGEGSDLKLCCVCARACAVCLVTLSMSRCGKKVIQAQINETLFSCITGILGQAAQGTPPPPPKAPPGPRIVPLGRDLRATASPQRGDPGTAGAV